MVLGVAVTASTVGQFNTACSGVTSGSAISHPRRRTICIFKSPAVVLIRAGGAGATLPYVKE